MTVLNVKTLKMKSVSIINVDFALCNFLVIWWKYVMKLCFPSVLWQQGGWYELSVRNNNKINKQGSINQLESLFRINRKKIRKKGRKINKNLTLTSIKKITYIMLYLIC